MDLSERNRSLIIVLFLLFTVAIITYFFLKQSGLFELRKRASTPSGATTLVFSPTDSTVHYPGDEFPIDLMFNTNSKKISAVAFRFIFQNSGIINVVDKEASRPDTQIVSFAHELDASFTNPVNQSAQQPSGQVYVDYSAVTSLTDGFSNTSAQRLASIIFKAVRVGNVAIDHDPSRSIVTEKITTGSGSGTLDILQTIPRYTVKVVADTQAPVVHIQGDFGQTQAATGSSVTFTWTGTEKPDRQAGVVAPILYSYQFDSQTWSSYSPSTTVTRVLGNGQHTFKVRAKDASGNVSTPTSPDSSRSFTINLAPRITAVSPQAGQIGTQVTISGYNFGARQDTATVKFGTTLVTNYDSWSDTQIVVRVPSGANGDIRVTRTPLTSNSFPFSLGTMLKVLFNLEGINQDRGMQIVELTVRASTQTTPQIFRDREAVWSTTDNAYSVTVGPLTGITTGNNYIISILAQSHLRKAYTGVTLTNNSYNTIRRTAASDMVRLADFDNDNKLTIEDIGLLLNKFIVISTPAVGTLIPFDVNRDGTFDSVDIAFVLSEYTQLEKIGDNP